MWLVFSKPVFSIKPSFSPGDLHPRSPLHPLIPVCTGCPLHLWFNCHVAKISHYCQESGLELQLTGPHNLLLILLLLLWVYFQIPLKKGCMVDKLSEIFLSENIILLICDWHLAGYRSLKFLFILGTLIHQRC